MSILTNMKGICVMTNKNYLSSQIKQYIVVHTLWMWHLCGSLKVDYYA